MGEDEPKQLYTAREIVLELFPATDHKLVPSPDEYRLERTDDGNLVIRSLVSGESLILTPIAQAGSATTQVCCDLCRRSVPRHYMQMYRVAIPGSGGRRFRYVSLCRNAAACDARRLSDEPVRDLLERVLGVS